LPTNDGDKMVKASIPASDTFLITGNESSCFWFTPWREMKGS